MKRIMIAAVILLAASLQGMAQMAAPGKPKGQDIPSTKADAGATCAGQGGNTCTDKELTQLGAMAGKRRHQTLTLTVGKGGALQCDRAPCPPDVLKDLSDAAAPLGLKITSAAAINTNSSRSNTQHN